VRLENAKANIKAIVIMTKKKDLIVIFISLLEIMAVLATGI
tara:strand:+ start:107 stop:229 length:123 start_codon:yes stop_codon:yes gene_type:complete